MNNDEKLHPYLESTYFIDSDSANIFSYANAICVAEQTETDKAIALCYGVRDDIRYDPYSMVDKREAVRASNVLQKKRAFAFPKRFY
jgi:transglutaminase-like putative cysteine protease